MWSPDGAWVAFTTWDDYDYVHILTHGAAACGEGNASHRCASALLAPWTEDYVRRQAASAESRGDEDLAKLLDIMGVEVGSFWVAAEMSGNGSPSSSSS